MTPETSTRSVPTWARGRTWYAVHALAASPGAASPADALAAIVDHAAALGAGGILCTPVFASSSHGYDTIDPFRVDPRLGTEPDLLAVVQHARARGLRVLFDGVFNHVGRDFPRFARVRAGERSPDVTGWFRIRENPAAWDGFDYDTFEGHGSLVALNHANPAVLDWAVDVACYWLERGIDGWRLDAAYAVPTAFWRAWSDRVLARFPDALLLGEVIHGDQGAFCAASGLASITQYPLHKAIWSSLNDGNFFELAWALDQHEALVAGGASGVVPLTFVGNHDVTRILSRLRDPATLHHALAVLFTAPGMPAIYYGDEIALRGVKENRVGGDDAIRPRFPLPLPPLTAEQAEVLALHRSLVALRAQRPWLTTAHVRVAELANRRVRIVAESDGRAVMTVLSLEDQPLALPDGGRGWRPIAGDGAGQDALAAVAPRGWAVLERR